MMFLFSILLYTQSLRDILFHFHHCGVHYHYFLLRWQPGKKFDKNANINL